MSSTLENSRHEHKWAIQKPDNIKTKIANRAAAIIECLTHKQIFENIHWNDFSPPHSHVYELTRSQTDISASLSVGVAIAKWTPYARSLFLFITRNLSPKRIEFITKYNMHDRFV